MTTTIYGLSLAEWCDYWKEGSDHYVTDGWDITARTRKEFADASASMRDLLDTVKACLIAAGGSDDDGSLEMQCRAAGDKPSDFIKAVCGPLLALLDEWHLKGRSHDELPVVQVESIWEIERVIGGVSEDVP